MASKIKNIIIFLVIGLVLLLIYTFFIKRNGDQTALTSSTVSSSSSSVPSSTSNPTTADSQITQDFLALLLNIKSIKLDDTIFSDPAFNSLFDSSITLTPDGTEGRPNPFAPLGSDLVAAPVNVLNTVITPPPTPLLPPPVPKKSSKTPKGI